MNLYDYVLTQIDLINSQEMNLYNMGQLHALDRVINFIDNNNYSPKNYSLLKQELKDFVESTVYKGYLKPFKFVDFFPNTGDLDLTCPTGLSLDEKIDEIDKDYHNKLKEIGNKYKISIHIPYWYFTK